MDIKNLNFSELRICKPPPRFSFDQVFMDDAEYAE